LRFLIILVLFAYTANAQTIINAERVGVINDSSVFAIDVTYQGTRGNSVTNQFGVAPVMVLKKHKNEFKMFGAYDVLSASDKNILNSAYVHARHNFEFLSKVRTLLFYQLQFNEVLRLSKREVIGAGFKFSLFEKDSFSLFVSTGLMHEFELIDREGLLPEERYKSNFVRGSAIVSLRWVLSKNVQLNNVFYYQPYLKGFADYRMLNDINFLVKLNKHLSLLAISSLRQDSKPPSSIGSYDWSFKFGVNAIW
jgi:hypothetical protein